MGGGIVGGRVDLFTASVLKGNGDSRRAREQGDIKRRGRGDDLKDVDIAGRVELGSYAGKTMVELEVRNFCIDCVGLLVCLWQVFLGGCVGMSGVDGIDNRQRIG